MKRPPLTPPPLGFSAFDGDIVKHIGKRANVSIAIVAQELGNEEGLYDWVKRHPDNERDFWTKLFPRIMAKQVEHTASEGVEALLKQVAAREDTKLIDCDADEVDEDATD